jgi:ATP-dependent Clp protease adaptor protein ClpS
VPRSAATPAPVRRQAEPQTQVLTRPEVEPPYHVILLDDDQHTYAYVIEMLQSLLGHPFETAFKMADKVNAEGRVIVATCHKELAELRQEQIQEFGPDPRLPESKGSMSAMIEPAE